MKTLLFLLPLAVSGCIYIEDPGRLSDADSGVRITKPVPDSSRHTQNPHNTRTHLIRSADGKCLDYSRSGYKGIITYPCHGENNQQFTFSRNRIMVEGLCLDIAGERNDDGTPVIAYSCHGNKNQQWYRDGKTIRSALNGKCLDAGKHNNQIRMYRCDGSLGQRFDISRY